VTETTSFRDPGGFVRVAKDRVIRTVRPAGRSNLEAYLKSAAAARFVESGGLISSQTIPNNAGSSDAADVVVEHPRIPFPSYAHEWPAAMLHAAGALTIDLSTALLEEGRGLKDATPSNVLFRGARPVFIDVLSIEEREPLDPIWLPAAQFARTFLIPLLLEKRTGAPAHENFVLQRDGVTPQSAVGRLPFPRRWFPPDLGLVTLPARAAAIESAGIYQPRRTRDAGEARFVLERYFRGLRNKLDGLAPAAGESGQERSAPRFEIRPERVLDIGGTCSLAFASSGASVVAIDRDAAAMGDLWRRAAATSADVLSLVVDFARATPAMGWRGEQSSFMERAAEYFDCVVLMEGMHRLMVTDQIPPDQVFEAFADLTTGWLIVEYVARDDARFRRVARGRDALYEWFTREAFEESARRRFDIVNSDNAVYLLRRRQRQ